MATAAVADVDAEQTSIFQSNLPLREKLDRARMELLDLSARNRLLNMPRSAKSTRLVEIVDEKSDEIFRLLARESKVFTFAAGKAARPGEEDASGEVDEIADLAQPEDDEADERGVASRHADTRLQTRLTPKGLQKRLLELYFDARTLEEEQGVNILYLTLGSLKWVDPSNAANVRHAPLILLPVSLERGNAGEKFKLRIRPEDFASNLSLEAFLDRVHGLKLPAFEATDAFDLRAYLAEVADAVATKPDWAVIEDDIALGFFSFAKFLMYRDLDPDTWPENGRISDRPLVRGLLTDGFETAEGMIPEDANVDGFIEPADMLHIVDSDSSQALAVHEVRRGRDMVIQGPPGTGKSQTIANIVASAIADGKTVLFVAEKMAALEVVKRRLDATGVGDACLELHSNKANKRAVLEELRRTWELGAPRGQSPGTLFARLTEARDRLNGHAARLHAPHSIAGLTPYQVIGQLTRLRLEGERPNEIALSSPEIWSGDDFSERHDVLSELVERVEAIGRPVDHVWYGVGLSAILPADVERLTDRIERLADRVRELDRDQTSLAQMLERGPAATLGEISDLAHLARRVAGAPPLSASALASPAWAQDRAAVDELLLIGERHHILRNELAGEFQEAGWSTDLVEACAALAELPDHFSPDGFVGLARLASLLPMLIAESEALARLLGCDPPTTCVDATRLARLGERVSQAPDASPDALRSPRWDGGVDQAADLAEAVAGLEAARAQIGDGLADAAWSMDLAPARTTLAMHGSGFMRLFSGEWRQANRLVRSVLADPTQPLESTLAQLDALANGQAARATIQADDEFGREVFGADWRGERSSSAPLLALVEWVRSTRELGSEARILAAAKPDRDAAKAHAERLSAFLDEASPALRNLFDGSGAARTKAFGEAPLPDRADAAALLTTVVRWHEADRLTAGIAHAVPADLTRRRALLALLREGQERTEAILGSEAVGHRAFGDAWNAAGSDWPLLSSAAAWIADNDDIRMLVSRTTDRDAPADSATAIAAARDALVADLLALFDDLTLDAVASLGSAKPSDLSIGHLADRLAAWSGAGEQLFKWVAYRDRAERSRALGCGEVVARMEDGRVPPERVVPAFEMAYYEALYADQVKADPELGRFDGTLHGRLAHEFADLDRQRIASASLEVVRAHHKAIPPRDGGAVGPLGALRGEINKKRGHMPIRKLMERAGPAVQALKPVFMMSPLSVAQFLTPGVFEFDLLVMDEASQIQPVDALGAVARAKQVVVVGDPKQLPPTAFFSKLTGGGADDDDDEGGRVADIESILGLFTARGLPNRMLRWHYRSRHQSLIAVSNRQFYESKLFIVPSPYTAEAGMGLRFHHVPQGLFDAGGTRTNMVEARIVAQAIVAHARECPHLSLGVAAFSAAQRRAILDQLELLRRSLPPEVESFFRAHPSEPFFVKNLENVQGDERDVIFISVGYGPSTAGGRVPMRFGPLGSEGGERRLNVLISRAKQRCEVFASMTDEDIDPDFAASRKGVFAFKLFLHFARTGRLTMAESTGRDHDSVFEEQVANALQSRGYHVHRQVGLAGFYIDLAVADPERPGRYILGIECDGASYHDARSARDRDRLRQSVLESHGWHIHRIWSTDWFQRPNEQLEVAVARIEAAKAELEAEAAGRKASRAVPVEILTVERDDVVEIGFGSAETPSAVSAYVEAEIARPAHVVAELHETPRGILSGLAEQVVEVEGPVHLDEVVNRIRSAWGLKRAGGRIQECVEQAVDVSMKVGRIRRDGDFLSAPGREPVVRDRSQVRSATLRRPDALPPAEVETALVHIVRTNFGATDDQVVQAASRMVGFKSTSGQLRSLILDVAEGAVGKGWLARQNGILVLGAGAPTTSGRIEQPASPIDSLISKGEHERLEFKETLRWDVAQAQPNKKLEEVVVKTLAGFANRVGGTLLIGVTDAGQVVGLERDYACVGGGRDKLELHLTNLLAKHFGAAFRAARIRISFPQADGLDVCRIDVDRSPSATFVSTADRNGTVAERFYVRSGNSTQELAPSQMATYMRDHFG